MINLIPESNIDDIEVIKPNIPGDFISTPAPDVFLLIKGGLIWRKVFQMNLSMALQEKLDLFSFMPFSTIHIEINDITTELFQHMLQHLQKSLLITSGNAYQPFSPQQGRHPAGQIE